MGLFDHFPYTNVHELNLDWILSMMKALEAEWEAFTAGNSLTFADPLQHDTTKTYAKNTIVIDGSGNAYVSLQAVPVGVALGNQDYWLMVFDYETFIEKVNKNFTARYYRGSYRATAAMAIGDWLTVDDVLCKATAAIAADDVLEVGVNIEHFTLEDFIKAFMQSANQLIQQYKNDIDASELAYRQQLAQDIADTTASLQAQLDAAISGATVDSEVINARVGIDGTIYPTLHDAIVTQFENDEAGLNMDGSLAILFEHGSVGNNGEDSTWNKESRVRSKIHYFDCSFTIAAKNTLDSSAIDVAYFADDGTYESSVGWYKSITIPVGKKFRMCLSLTPGTNTAESVETILNGFELKFNLSSSEVINARTGVDKNYSTLGDAIRGQHSSTISNLINDNVYDILCDFPFTNQGPYNGITITVPDQSTFILNGTATADANFNLYSDTSNLLPHVEAGKYYLFDINGTFPAGASFKIFTYRGGSWADLGSFTSSAYVKIATSGDTGTLLRFYIENGTALNNVTIKVRMLTINPNNPVIYPVYPYSSSDVIDYCMTNYGKVILAEGTHQINNTINMPDNTRITGYGSGSIVSISTGIDGIVVGARCSIDNIYLKGYYGAGSPSPYAAIKISKNYDTPPLIYETKLSNLRITNMGFGILGEKTGYWVGCSISADNIEISNCYEGIKLWKHCEFVRFTNINSHDNDIGIRNQSGNNKFINCSFSNNRINCYLDGYTSSGNDEGENNGHGCFVGCDFNHADNNTGISILAKYIDTNGFIFEGCNIWYGRIEIDEGSTGILISNCLFGGGTPTVNIFGGSDVMLFNNLFKTTPTINDYGTFVEDNNYLFDGTHLNL